MNSERSAIASGTNVAHGSGMTRFSMSIIFGLTAALAVAACNKDGLTGDPQPTPTPAPEPGSIAGRVCAPNGDSWLSGAQVWVSQGGAQDSTTTNSNGDFLLGGVDAGSQTLHIQSG